MLPCRGDPPFYTYVPDPRPTMLPATVRVSLLIADGFVAHARRRARDEEYLRAHPEYQTVCRCGHRVLAHDGGDGPCLAKKCPCRRYERP